MTRECKRTGTGSPARRSSASSAVSSGASSSSSSLLQRSSVVPGGIFAANGRAQESKLGRLADDQADLGAGNVGFGAFLHAHRDDAQAP